MFRFLFRSTATAVLLLLTYALIEGMASTPLHLDPWKVVVPFAAGFVLGIVLCLSVSQMLTVYVYGHELTHWLAAKLFLRETPHCEIRAQSGNVAVERPNIWIILAPYFVPVYTLILIGVYGVTCFFWHDQPLWVHPVVVGLGGVTYAFHVALTLYALSRAQTDLAAHGPALSLSLILFCNVAIVLAVLLLATGEWRAGVTGVGRGVRREADLAVRGGRWTWHTVEPWIARQRTPAGKAPEK